MIKFLFIGLIYASLAVAPRAEARKLEPSLPAALLEKAGLPFPASAVYLHMNGQEENPLAELCPTPGFSLFVSRNASHEAVSRSLKIVFKNGRPEFDECIRTAACELMTSKEIKSAASSGLKKYQMEGRGGNYSVEIISPANLPLKPLTCASAASEIKTNNYPDITLPNVLWLLNYGSRLTLFSEASQRAWFNISLPAGVKFNKKLNAAMDAAGRLLVSDNTTVLFLDLQLDAALLFNPQSVYKTRWGAASAAFTAEWEAMNKHVLAFASEQRDRKPLFMLNGIAAGKHFWTWEKIISLLKGESPAPFYLPGELVTAGEKLTPTARVSTFATRDSEGKAQVSQFDSSRGTMTLVRKNLPLDHRARNEHFVLLEDDIYRFTADGLYKAESGAEVPTVLKGFKGTLKNQIHFLQSKEQVGKSCEMRIWSNKADFVGLLSTALSQLQCNQDEGFAVTPWAYSASWVSGGQVKTQVAAHD